MSLIITDTSCLITLERIDQLDLIPAVFPDVAAPPAVIGEFGWKPTWLTVLQVRDQARVEAIRTQLDIGEAEALALALEHPGSAVLVDEKKARRVAHHLGLTTIGTVGLLLRAKRQHLVPAVKPLLEALLAANFRVSDALYQEVLRRAGEAA